MGGASDHVTEEGNGTLSIKFLLVASFIGTPEYVFNTSVAQVRRFVVAFVGGAWRIETPNSTNFACTSLSESAEVYQ